MERLLKKDFKLAKKQNKNLDKLFEVIDILANGGTLEAKYRDHDFIGNYYETLGSWVFSTATSRERCRLTTAAFWATPRMRKAISSLIRNRLKS